MKSPVRSAIRRLIVGAALVALPQVLLARGTDVHSLPCPPDAPGPHAILDAPPPPEMLPEGDGEPPWMRGLDLTEAQHDAIFELMHARQPARRTLEKKARRALETLQRLAASKTFDAGAARTLANDYAQAIAELAFNHAQHDAQLRALLTAEQRQRVDMPPAGGPQPPLRMRAGER